MTFSINPEQAHKLTWFIKSPDAGDPDCICSLCGEQIPEDDPPFRMWTTKRKPMLEARLHWKCFELVILPGR